MEIKVNGQSHKLPGRLTLAELLAQLDYRDPFVAIAVNGTCIPRQQHQKFQIGAADEVEILSPMSGG